jgi:diketogulonate reductase-like aldo/keto reductase
MAENFDVFDFQLSDDELACIEALDSGIRGGPDPDIVDPMSRSIEIPEA